MISKRSLAGFLRARPGDSRTIIHVNDRDELSRRLWLLRNQMEQLACALEIQQLVLANNRLRWLPMVTENVELIAADIRESEADRLEVTERVTAELGLAPNASLLELAEAAGEPHGPTWSQTRLHLVSLQAEIDQFSNENRELTRQGLSSTNLVIGHLAGERNDTYAPDGATTRLAPAGSSFDRTA